jgi:NTP pyrophosphatase (non-canonical NTP hydrolase)
MTDLKQTQQEVYGNKVAKGFNVTDVALEFCLAHEELSEAFAAYRKKLPDLGEELADAAIYLLGIAEIVGVDLGQEIDKKIEKNRNRRYEVKNGVMTRVKDE